MKYTNCLKRQLGIVTFLAVFLSSFSISLIAQTPDGLITPTEEDLVFANQLDIDVDTKAIEIKVQFTSKVGNAELASAEHLKTVNELRSKILVASASVTSVEEDDIIINRPQFARLRFAKPEAQSDFIVSVTTDYQLTETIKILTKTSALKIQGYDIVYDDNIGSDDKLTTDLTNQILEDIRKQTKETGKSLTPRGFSELGVVTVQTGREKVERLLDGKKLKNWKPSEQKITLIKTTKTVSVALITY